MSFTSDFVSLSLHFFSCLSHQEILFLLISLPSLTLSILPGLTLLSLYPVLPHLNWLFPPFTYCFYFFTLYVLSSFTFSSLFFFFLYMCWCVCTVCNEHRNIYLTAKILTNMMWIRPQRAIKKTEKPNWSELGLAQIVWGSAMTSLSFPSALTCTHSRARAHTHTSTHTHTGMHEGW